MLRRPSLVAACAFWAGIAAVITGKEAKVLVPTVLLVIVCAVVLKRAALKIILFTALFLILGAVRANIGEEAWRKAEFEYGGQTYNGEFVVTDFCADDSAYAQFYDNGKKVKVFLSFDKERLLYPGDILKGKVTFRALSKSKAGVQNFGTYLAGEGIHLFAKADNTLLCGEYTKGIDGKIFSLRRYLHEIGEKSFSGDVRALFDAMVFGDKSLITPELDSILQGAGLNHLAVVSGMHLTIMMSVQMLLINRIFGKKRAGNLIGMLAALFLTFVTGCGASVVRACIMCVLSQCASMLYRENDSISSLSFALFVMALINPYVIFSAGLILSALSVLGIILYNEKMLKMFSSFLPKTPSESMAVSLSASIAVSPAVICYFGIVTPYSVLANLFVFPFATAMVPVGMAYALLCNVKYISGILRILTVLFAEGIIGVSKCVSALPGAITNVGPLTFPLLSVWIALMAAIYFYPEKIKRTEIAAGLLCALFCLVALADGINAERMHFEFFTYGARATVLVSPGNNGRILIDCEDAYDAREILEKNGTKSALCGVVTGKDYEQMLLLAKDKEVGVILFSEKNFDAEKRKKIKNDFYETGARVEFLGENENMNINGAIIDYLELKKEKGDLCAVRIEYGGNTFVSLQGLSSAQTESLINENVKIECDALYLPFTVFHENTVPDTLTDGKIIQNKKEFSLKNLQR